MSKHRMTLTPVVPQDETQVCLDSMVLEFTIGSECDTPPEQVVEATIAAMRLTGWVDSRLELIE